MTDMPNFDTPVPPAEPPAPKKPRRKPVRKARKAGPKVVKKRGKRRVIKVVPAKEEVFLSPEVYKTIRTLVDLSASERGMVMAIVKGLTNGRVS